MWRDDFLKQRPHKTVADLKVETNMKMANRKLSEILAKQRQAMKNEAIKKEIKKLVFGE